MRPVLCFITDRKRSGAAWAPGVVERVEAAARGGVDLIQVREHGLDDHMLADLVERCVAAVRGTRARVVVNDRPDVALAAGAHGVHLRGDSVPARRVRAIAPAPFLVGRSVHAAEEAARVAREGGLDYLIFGTVFETSSKPGRPAAGLTSLASVAASTAIPVLGVGGIGTTHVRQVMQTGAAGIAAIGLFNDCAPDRLPEVIRGIFKMFDTPGRVP